MTAGPNRSRRAPGPNPTGATVELALSYLRVEAQRGLAPREWLRDHLLGLKPERRESAGTLVGDRGLVDRTLYDFLSHHWFRVEVYGIDNAPEDNGARSSATTGARCCPEGS